MTTLRTLCALLVAAACVAGCDDEPTTCTPTNNGVEYCYDGIDNDCNGMIDDCPCTPTNGGVEACGDNIDNDCDRAIDEGCGTGLCSDGETRGCGATPQAGVCLERCTGGAWGTCISSSGAQEICGNAIDDNCNNQVDEYCECDAGATRECGGSAGSNLCAESCQNGRWTSCVPRPPNTGDEICDGLDNDCDGAIDNGDCTCERGEEMWCGGTPEYHQCHQTCPDGVWTSCTSVSGPVREDVCGDGQDNDCDGHIDEPEVCSNACGEGEARCEGMTRGPCRNDAWDCMPGDTQTELCTGEDEGICDPGERTRTCRSNCVWDSWASCTGVVVAEWEECNGLDDDCNGLIDDGVTGYDSYGWNDTCGDAYWLGTDPNVYVYGMLSDTSDWFSFTAVDNWGLTPEHISLQIVPPLDMDVRLTLSYGSCGSLIELASADIGYDGDAEVIDWVEEQCTSGCEDDGEYFVEVYTFGSSPEGCYELLVNGLN
jgi:hypothetical protein